MKVIIYIKKISKLLIDILLKFSLKKIDKNLNQIQIPYNKFYWFKTTSTNKIKQKTSSSNMGEKGEQGNVWFSKKVWWR